MTTLKENSTKNLVWFHSLPEYEKECLIDLISPIHYASVYHDELKRIYKKYAIDQISVDLPHLTKNI